MKKIFKSTIIALLLILSPVIIFAGTRVDNIPVGKTIIIGGKTFVMVKPSEGLIVSPVSIIGDRFDFDNTQIFDPVDSNNVAYWLNNTYYNEFSSSDKAIIKNATWYIGDETNETSASVTAHVGLLRESEYNAVRGTAFPSGGEYAYWSLITPSSSSSASVRRVTLGGGVNNEDAQNTTGVRPALKILESTILESDNFSNTYYFGTTGSQETFSNLNVGDKILFAGETWLVIKPTEGLIITEKIYGQREFDPDNTQIFNPNDTNNIAYWLNNTYYNEFSSSDKAMIKNSTWYIGDETNETLASTTARVGLLRQSEYEALRGTVFPEYGEYARWWLITPDSSRLTALRDVFNVGSVLYDDANYTRGVRACIRIQESTILESVGNKTYRILKTAMSEITDLGNTNISLNITNSSLFDAGTEYQFYRSTQEDLSDEQIVRAYSTSTSFNDTGLTEGTTYYYRIKVKENGIEGIFSGVKTIETFKDVPITRTPDTMTPYPVEIKMQAGSSTRDEMFEGSFNLWNNTSDDDLDWQINSGSTPSSSTGPSAAQEGSEYIYIETSGNYNKIFNLEGPSVISGEEIDFYYHMYGSSMGTLKLQGYNGSSWEDIWTKTGDQGDQWNNEKITFTTSYEKIRFNAVSGTSYRSDIALDNIKITKPFMDAEYRIDGGTWQDYLVPFNVTENCLIEARHKKYGFHGNITSLNVDNIFVNDPPTQPGTLTVPAMANEGDEMPVSWGASTDPNGNDITYIVEASYYDGSTWSAYSEYSSTINTSINFPIMAGSKIKLRVKATDSYEESIYSAESNEVTISYNGIMIKDMSVGDTLLLDGKTFRVVDPSQGFIISLGDGVSRKFDFNNIAVFDPTNSNNIGYYLNNSYYDTFGNKEKHLMKTVTWYTGDETNETATSVSAKIGLLRASEYTSLLGSLFPNAGNNTRSWLITPDSSSTNDVFYINGSGSIVSRSADSEVDAKTCIKIIESTIFSEDSFSGVKYIKSIEEENKTTKNFESLDIGDKIVFASKTYLVANPNDGLVISEKMYENRAFDTDNTNIFDSSDSNNIGYYLNNDFYNSFNIAEKELIEERTWYIGDETYEKANSVNEYIGMLRKSEYESINSNLFHYNGGSDGWWLITPEEGSTSIYTVYIEGFTMQGGASIARSYRPSFKMKKSLKFESVGNRTYKIIPNDPPTQPGELTVPATGNEGENISVNWGASTDIDGDTINYVVEASYYDGISWSNYNKYDSTTNTSINFPVMAGSKVKLRVKATDSYEDSGYVESTEITVNSTGTMLKDMNVGDTVIIDDKTFYIVDPTNGLVVSPINVKVIRFDINDTQFFDPEDANNIGYYLNNDYYNTFDKSGKHFIKNATWYVGDETNETSESITAYIGGLRKSQYESLRGSVFPQKGESLWSLLTRDSTDSTKIYVVSNTGGNTYAKRAYDRMGARPAIKFEETLLFDQDNLTNIYYIKSTGIQKNISDLNIGDRILLNEEVWNIIDPSNGKIITEKIHENRYFDPDWGETTFNPLDVNNIGYYLNNDFYNTFNNDEKNAIKESTWNIGDETDESSSSVNAKVGFLTNSEYNSIKGIIFPTDGELSYWWLINPKSGWSDRINIVSFWGTIDHTGNDNEWGVRPVVNIDNLLVESIDNSTYKIIFNTPPTIDIDSSSTTQYAKSDTNITITGNITDTDGDDVTVSATIDGVLKTDTVTGGSGSYNISWQGSEVTDGTYNNIIVTADDSTATNTATYTGNLIVDKSIPNTPTLNMSESWSNSEVTFTLTDNLDIGGAGIDRLEYKIDSGSWTAYSSETTARSTTGTSTVYVRAIDNAGNISAETSKVARVDKTLPSATFTPNEQATWQNSDIAFNIDFSDDESGLNITEWAYSSDDGSTWSGYTGVSDPADLSFTSSGYRKARARVVDNVGNENVLESGTYLLDKEFPVITFGINGDTTYEKEHGTQAFINEQLSGISSLQYKWSESDTTPSSGWLTFETGDILTQNGVTGDYYLHIKATDNVGNESNNHTNVFKLDNTNPSYISSSISGYDYKDGNNYWIKTGQNFKYNIRFEDLESGLNTSSFRIDYSDNRAEHDFNISSTHLNVNQTSSDTTIEGVTETYNSGNEIELEWDVLAINDSIGLSNLEYLVTDNTLNNTGYIVANEKIGIDGNSPSDFTINSTVDSDSEVIIDVGSVTDIGSGTPTDLYSYYNNDNDTWSTWRSDTSYTVTNLEPNRNYTLQVKARDNVGNEKIMTTTNYTESSIPNSLTATKNTTAKAKKIVVQWQDNGNPALTEYELEVSDDGVSGWSQEYLGNNLQYTHTGLNTNEEKYYRVRSINESGVYSDYTSVVSGRALNSPNVSSNVISNGSSSETVEIDLNWSAVEGADSYYLWIFDGGTYRGYDIGNVTNFNTNSLKIYPSEAQITSWDGNSDPFRWDNSGVNFASSLNDLYLKEINNTTYDSYSHFSVIQITAVDNEGNNAGGPNDGADVLSLALDDAVAPNIASEPTVENVISDAVSLSTSGSDKYMTADYPGSNLPSDAYMFKIVSPLTESSWRTNTHTFNGLDVNTEYSFAAKARDNAGNQSNYSNIVTVYTLAEKPSLTLNSSNQTGINMDINDNGNPGYTEYYVQRALDSGFTTGVAVAQNWSTDTNFTDNGLTPGETYYYRVKARNQDNIETAYSNVENMITEPTTIDSATGNNGGLSWSNTAGRGWVTLDWSAIQGADGYKVHVFDGQTYREFDVGNQTSFDSRIEKIYPSEIEINSFSDNTRSTDIFAHDKSGVDLRDDPSQLYVTATNTTYNSQDNYWFRISSYNSSGSAGYGDIVYQPTLPDRTDVDGPIIDFITNGNLTYEKEQSTIVNVTDNESGVNTVEYKWSTSTTTPSSGWQVFTNGDELSIDSVTGDYYLHIRSTDYVGNTSNLSSNVFKLDNTLPTLISSDVTQYDYNAASVYWIKGGNDFKIKIRGEDIHSKPRYTWLSLRSPISNGAYYSFSSDSLSEYSTSTYTDIVSATKTFEDSNQKEVEFTINANSVTTTPNDLRTRFKDFSDNETSNIDLPQKIAIDSTLPTVSVVPNEDAVWKNTNIDVQINSDDLESGLNRYRVYHSTDGGNTFAQFPVSDLTGIRDEILTSEGRRQIRVISEDNVGNERTYLSGFYHIDKTSPNINIMTNGNTTYQNSQSTVVNADDVNGSLDTSGVNVLEYQWATSSTFPTSGTFTAFTSGDTISLNGVNGDYYLHIRAIDNAGNIEEVTSNVFKFDNTIPEYVSTSITAYDYRNGNDYWINQNNVANVKIRGRDGLSGILNTFIRIDNGIDDNRARHDWDNMSTHLDEWITSTYTDIISANETYESGNEKEVEFGVRGLKDMSPKNIKYQFRDNSGNELVYTDSSNRLGIDGTSPNISSFTSTETISSISVSVSASDSLSGLHDSESYEYLIKEKDGVEISEIKTTDTNHTFTGLKTNVEYDVKVIVKDNVGNTSEQVITTATLTEDPTVKIIQKTKSDIVLDVIENPINFNKPEVKIILTNLSKDNVITETDWTTDQRITINGLSYGKYKVEYKTRNVHNIENEIILINSNLMLVSDVTPPEIQEYELDYGNTITTKDNIDIKLVASDNITSMDDLRVAFEKDGILYGYKNGSWVTGEYGVYNKYYGSFPLPDYRSYTIGVAVKDSADNIIKSAQIIERRRHEDVEQVIEPIDDTGDYDSTNPDIYAPDQDFSYNNAGYIITADRIVKLKLKTTNATEAQYSHDSISWSPWESVKGGYIDKNITLDGNPNIKKTVYVKTRNDAGVNPNIEVNYFILDQIAPEIKASTTSNINIAKDGQVALRIELTDAVSDELTYEISIAKNGVIEKVMTGTANSASEFIKQITGLGKGFYNVMISAKDQVNNESEYTMNIWSK